jgi:hypothetical protein
MNCIRKNKDYYDADKRVDKEGNLWEWRGNEWHCIEQADTPQTEEGAKDDTI